MKQKKIIVAMSGGVDSSVAALILQQQDYLIEGLFMKNWEEETDTNATQRGCQADQDFIDAKTVCATLGIRLHSINFSTEYWDRVFENFLQACQVGHTPNPDILCNREIKFHSLRHYALDVLGGDGLATGHYARVHHQYNKIQLLKGQDLNKDQSYFLYALNQRQLEHTYFPLGELTKPEIRRIAKIHGLKNHNKKDSTGICFIGERKFSQFLSQYLPTQTGNIETETGDMIGQHHGLAFYTLGQRRGIGVGGLKNYPERPFYVAQKDYQRNVLIVVQQHDHPLLMHKKLTADQLNWIEGSPPPLPFSCQAKIRYRQADQACQIESIEGGLATVTFVHPQRAITPGQSIVFYQGDLCLGGGIIQNMTNI